MSKKILFCSLFILIFLIPLKQDSNAKTWERHNTTIHADSILAAIDRGDSVEIRHCRIYGPLIKQGTRERPDTIDRFLEINSSIFHDKVAFEHCYFMEELDFWGDNLAGAVNFSETTFGGRASFRLARFRGEAIFELVRFSRVADFGHAGFSREALFDFTTFKGEANFQKATFSGKADFRYVTFGGYAFFPQATFGGETYFAEDTFRVEADFRLVNFDSSAYFDGCEFRGEATFFRSVFDLSASFIGATFGRQVEFGHTSFGRAVDFSWVSFDSSASFRYTIFNSSASFSAATFGGDIDFIEVNFRGPVFFIDASFDSSARARFRDAIFDTSVSFLGTHFLGGADFEAISFSEDADFSDAEFSRKVYLSPKKFKDLNISWKQLEGYLVYDRLANYKLRRHFEEKAQFNDADGIYLFIKDQERMRKPPWVRYPEYWFVYLTCGYGTKPVNTLILSIVLVFLFAIFFTKSGAIKEIEKESGHRRWRRLYREIPKTRRKRFYYALYFSLHTFIIGVVSDWHATDEFLIKRMIEIKLFKFGPNIKLTPRFKFRTLSMMEGALGWILVIILIISLERTIGR